MTTSVCACASLAKRTDATYPPVVDEISTNDLPRTLSFQALSCPRASQRALIELFWAALLGAASAIAPLAHAARRKSKTRMAVA
jgi:hypothetical protein